jgi:hypothetical protein
MIAEIATAGAFIVMALFLIVGLPSLVRMYEHKLSHLREMAKLAEGTREAEHRRSLELTETLRDPSPLELEARKEEAKARGQEALNEFKRRNPY